MSGGPPFDVCLVVEDGYPHRLDAVAVWCADLVSALAPRRLALVSVLTEGPPPANDVAAPPPHVAALGQIVFGAGGLRVHGLERGGGRAQASTSALSRMLSRAARERYAEALDRVVPLFEAIAGKRAGRDATTRERHDLALEVLAGDGPWGLDPRGLFDTELARARLEALEGEREQPTHALPVPTLVRAVLEPLARLLQVSLPPARCYYAVGGSFAAHLALAAARRTGGSPVVIAEASHGLERRLLQLHRGWELGAPEAERDVGRRQERAAECLHRLALERADAIVATGPSDRAFLVQCGAPPERVHVIRPGSHLPPVAADAPVLQAVAARPPWFVASWGAVDPIGDTLTFVRCARELVERLDLARFVSIGSLSAHSAYYHGCLEQARLLYLAPLLRFLGPRPEEEVLAQLHCLVATSVSSRGGAAIAEALAVGVPVVAVDTPAHRELLGEGGQEAGLLAPPGDPVALADAVARLLHDDALRRERIGRGRERAVQQLDRRAALQRHAQLVDELLAAAARRGRATASTG
ncbi:MAG: glycosyltransferase [Planctomycetota bacterium]|nr:MAG: glycosyltransferase [Planctomycetota bacterium]